MVKYKNTTLKEAKDKLFKYDDASISDRVVFASTRRPRVREIFLTYDWKPTSRKVLKISPSIMERLIKTSLKIKRKENPTNITYVLK